MTPRQESNRFAPVFPDVGCIILASARSTHPPHAGHYVPATSADSAARRCETRGAMGDRVRRGLASSRSIQRGPRRFPFNASSTFSSRSRADVILDRKANEPNRSPGWRLWRIDCPGALCSAAVNRGYSTEFLRRVPSKSIEMDSLFRRGDFAPGRACRAKIAETNQSFDTLGLNRRKRKSRGFSAPPCKFRMHGMGNLCDLKYRNLTRRVSGQIVHDVLVAITLAFEQVRREKPPRCWTSAAGRGSLPAVARRWGIQVKRIQVSGIDFTTPLPGMMREFHTADLERDPLPVDAFAYDCVLLLGCAGAHVRSGIISAGHGANRSRPRRSLDANPRWSLFPLRIVAFAGIRWKPIAGPIQLRGARHPGHHPQAIVHALVHFCGRLSIAVTSWRKSFRWASHFRLSLAVGWEGCWGLSPESWPGPGRQCLRSSSSSPAAPKPGVRQLLAQQPPITATATAAAKEPFPPLRNKHRHVQHRRVLLIFLGYSFGKARQC